MLIKAIYHKIVPAKLQQTIASARYKQYLSRLKKDIIAYYESSEELSNEEAEIVSFLKKNEICVFPYNFIHNYRYTDWKVFRDNGIPYVFHEGKKLFFRRTWPDEYVQKYYNFLITEQDYDSPHRYLTPQFSIKYGSVMADVGAAEGILALSEIDNLSQAYLFEPEQEWIEALEYTFAPWKEKVHIVKNFVSNINEGEFITLDAFFRNKKVDFIKADIEGFEMPLIDGAKEILKTRSNIQLAICTYHKPNDAETINKILLKLGLTTEFSKGYMLFIYGNLTPPYLRKGILRAFRA